MCVLIIRGLPASGSAHLQAVGAHCELDLRSPNRQQSHVVACLAASRHSTWSENLAAFSLAAVVCRGIEVVLLHNPVSRSKVSTGLV